MERQHPTTYPLWPDQADALEAIVEGGVLALTVDPLDGRAGFTSLLRIEQQLGDRALYAGRTAVALL